MTIIGNQKIQNFLNKAIEKGLIAQAYVFSGPEEVGKFSLALELAGKITGKNKGPINPDILVVAPEVEEKQGKIRTKDIGIEEIRRIQDWLSRTSQLGGYKVVIINGGEKMKKSAQNGLLKTLEDTPEKAVLIVVTRKLENLLPTIISRSQVKKFSLTCEEELSKMIPEKHPQKNEIILWSMGRPGRIRKMLDNEELIVDAKNNWREFSEIMSASLSERLEKAEKLGKDSRAFLEKANVWMFALRQTILGKGIGIGVEKKKSFQILERIEKSVRLIEETNANTRLVLENLFLGL